MIKVLRGTMNNRGRFSWAVADQGLSLRGVSHQPLLDACREIKRTHAHRVHEYASLFREGRMEADITCSVEWGATHGVLDPPTRSPTFKKAGYGLTEFP
jgi:hypothetical protein